MKIETFLDSVREKLSFSKRKTIDPYNPDLSIEDTGALSPNDQLKSGIAFDLKQELIKKGSILQKKDFKKEVNRRLKEIRNEISRLN